MRESTTLWFYFDGILRFIAKNASSGKRRAEPVVPRPGHHTVLGQRKTRFFADAQNDNRWYCHPLNGVMDLLYRSTRVMKRKTVSSTEAAPRDLNLDGIVCKPIKALVGPAAAKMSACPRIRAFLIFNAADSSSLPSQGPSSQTYLGRRNRTFPAYHDFWRARKLMFILIRRGAACCAPARE